MIRVILCRVAEAPRVTSISPDDTGDYLTALQEILRGPVTRFDLYGDIQLWGHCDGLVAGLMLVRHILERSPADSGLRAIRILVEDLKKWITRGDFLLSRAGEIGEPSDLTESDIEHCMFWLSLDLMHR